MCGIVARLGDSVNCEKTLKMLKSLEYRGYDSYGILFSNGNLVKNIGSMDEEDLNSFSEIKSSIELTHTRWATHGGICKENAHPHHDSNKSFFVVMNGIIENYFKVKKELEEEGEVFYSKSDTEVLPKLFAKHFDSSKDIQIALLEVIKKVVGFLEGEFSFVLRYGEYLIAYKNTNPIILGFNSGEVFFCSDLGVIQENCIEYMILEDNEIALAKKGVSIEFYNLELMTISKEKFLSKKITQEDNKDTKYYMEKEMYEQREHDKILSEENINAIKTISTEFDEKEIVLLGAGTSYHAAYHFHYLLLKKGISSQVILASELENYIDIINNKIIFVYSQSGETADLISPLQKLKVNNKIIAITNSKQSTLDRLAEKSVYLNCGREIAVASTKAFTAQLLINSLLIKAYNKQDLKDLFSNYKASFDDCVEKNSKVIEEIANKFSKSNVFFFLGRNELYPIALEGALKLKEISYIHAQGYAAGELKHGTLALIEKGVASIFLGSNRETISNAIEVKTRGGTIIGIASKPSEAYDYYLNVPIEQESIFSTILMQLIAFKMTLNLNLNPDKPRNLAKSVTVK